MSYTYIASPYTHPDPTVSEARYQAVARYTAHLLRQNLMCFSPIVHNHIITIEHQMPEDSEFWRAHNYAMLSKASWMRVLCLPGYKDSAGVTDELLFAKQCGIPTIFEHSRAWTDTDTRCIAEWEHCGKAS